MRKEQIKVKGRGIHMNSNTRVVPHKHKDAPRLSTKAIIKTYGGTNE